MDYKTVYGENVAVIGASPDRKKFSNRAVREFLSQGYKVYPVNPLHDFIEGIKSFRSLQDIPDEIDFVSVYLNPRISVDSRLAEQIRDKKVKGVILNPGAESKELVQKLEEYCIDIDIKRECSIMGLRKK